MRHAKCLGLVLKEDEVKGFLGKMCIALSTLKKPLKDFHLAGSHCCAVCQLASQEAVQPGPDTTTNKQKSQTNTKNPTKKQQNKTKKPNNKKIPQNLG